MWIFSKIFKNEIDKIITREVNSRASAVEELLAQDIHKLRDSYTKERNNYEVSIVALQEELKNKRIEIDNKYIELENEHQDRVIKLTRRMETEVVELERVRLKAEEEQKRLWERLDILRDNLNTEDVWLKIWEMAYSKATDAVWTIMEKETLHLIELAERRALVKSKAEFDIELEQRMQALIKMANKGSDIPKEKILAIKKDLEDKVLQAERIKNNALVDKYNAQLEILGGLL